MGNATRQHNLSKQTPSKRRPKGAKKYADEEGAKEEVFNQAKADINSETQEWLLKYDTDNSRTFDRREMGLLLKSLLAEEEAKSTEGELVATVATSEDGINHEEYLDKIFHAESERRKASNPAQTADDGKGGSEASAQVDSTELAVPLERVHQWTVGFKAWVTKKKKVDQLFNAADSDKSGTLDKAELCVLLQKAAPAGYTVSDTDWNYVLEASDSDESKLIERSEVRAFVHASATPCHPAWVRERAQRGCVYRRRASQRDSRGVLRSRASW